MRKVVLGIVVMIAVVVLGAVEVKAQSLISFTAVESSIRIPVGGSRTISLTPRNHSFDVGLVDIQLHDIIPVDRINLTDGRLHRITTSFQRVIPFMAPNSEAVPIQVLISTSFDTPPGEYILTVRGVYSFEHASGYVVTGEQFDVESIGIVIYDPTTPGIPAPPSPLPPTIPGGAGFLQVFGGHGSVMPGGIGDAIIMLTNTSLNEDVIITNIVPLGEAGGITISPVGIGTIIGPGQQVPVFVNLNGVNLPATASGTFSMHVEIHYMMDTGWVQGVEITTITVEITPRPGAPTPRPSPTPTPPPIDRTATLELTSPRDYIVMRPGQTGNFTVIVRNFHQRNTARNLTLTADMVVGFRNQFTTATAQLVRADGGTATFWLRLNPQQGIDPGTYQVPISFYYFDQQGHRHTGTLGNITVVIEEEPTEEPHLIIDGFSMNTDIVMPGDSFTIFANVANMGPAHAEVVEVNISGLEQRGITLQGSDTVVLSSVWQENYAAFNLVAHEDIVPGNHPVTFRVRYTQSDGQTRTFESNYFITVGGGAAAAQRGRLRSVSLESAQGAVNVGQNAAIHFVARNDGEETATNVRVSLDIPSGLVPTSPNIYLLEELVPTDAYEFVFTVAPTADSRTQTYLVGVTTTWDTGRRNADGTVQTDSFTQYAAINVRRPDDAPATGAQQAARAARLSIVTQNPEERLGIGEAGTVYMTVTNTGNRAATNISIRGTMPENIVPASASSQHINELPSGQSRTLEFSFMPTASANPHTYMIDFEIDFENGIVLDDGTRMTTMFRYLGAHVNSRVVSQDDPVLADRSVPRIILSEFLITSTNEDNPQIALAGQEFDMFFVVHNTHPTKTVSNIIVSLTVPETGAGTAGQAVIGNVFSPVAGSNSFHISEIEPGGHYPIELRMFTLGNAQGRNYTMRIVFVYEEEDGTEHTMNQEVGITVRQPASIDIGDIIFPDTMAVGQSHRFTFFVQNTGFVTLRNFRIEAEGDAFDVSGATFIVGNLGMGGFEFYDETVVAMEPGEHELSIIISYGLDTLERIREVHTATITVTEGFGDFDDFGGGMGGMGGRPGMGQVVAMPDGSMVVMDGGMGGRPGMGMAGMDFDMGLGEPAPEGVVDTVLHWLGAAVDFANERIWPWLASGGAAVLVAALLIIKGIKRRKAYSL